MRDLRTLSDDVLDHVMAPYLYDKRIENGCLSLPNVGVQFVQKRLRLRSGSHIHFTSATQVEQVEKVGIGRSSNEMLAAFNMISMAK